MSDIKPTRSGRQARQAERSTRGGGIGRPYIIRNIPSYDVLSEENLIRIEAAADRILAETGIEFRDDPVALDHWRRAGAKVDGLLVKFEPGLLREGLKTAPAQFTQHARNPARNVEIGGCGFVTGTVFHPIEAGLVYARTDVGGAYRFDTATDRWIALNDDIGGLNNEFQHLGVLTIGLDPNDANRVYIAGLSAGGAMAAIVAAHYPDLFAAVGVHSGLPPGAAHDVVSAFSAMRHGGRSGAAGDPAALKDVMPTIVFHGDADRTVHPDNGDQIVLAAIAALKASGVTLKRALIPQELPAASGDMRHTLRTVYSAPDRRSYVEYWSVEAGPHAWSGGNATGSFTDPNGPDASAAMLTFFLQHHR